MGRLRGEKVFSMIETSVIIQGNELISLAEQLGLVVGAIAFLLVLGAIALEIRYRLRPGNDLELTTGDWTQVVREPHRYKLVGKLGFRNRNPYREVMVPDVQVKVRLLSKVSLAGIHCKTQALPRHADASPSLLISSLPWLTPSQ
jgi:hypothetical protein